MIFVSIKKKSDISETKYSDKMDISLNMTLINIESWFSDMMNCQQKITRKISNVSRIKSVIDKEVLC